MTIYYHAFGLRKTVPILPNKEKAERLISTYEKYISYLQVKLPCIIDFDYHFETKMLKGGKHNIHIHGMIKANRLLTFKDMPRQKGYKPYCEEVISKKAYYSYMTKDRTTKGDILYIIGLQEEYNFQKAQKSNESGSSSSEELIEIPKVQKMSQNETPMDFYKKYGKIV